MNADAPVHSYPPAPWQLRGASVQAFRFVDIKRAQRLVPRNVRVVPVLPGRTIAVMYCARYGPGSSLSYSEFAVAPALAEARGRVGFWISHIYVDNTLSIAGGREIWKLPKQPATFTWNSESREVVVAEGSLTLCRVSWDPRMPRLFTPVMAPVLIEEWGRFRTFWLRGTCRLGVRRTTIVADPQSPVTDLGLTRSRRLLWADPVTLRIAALHR